MKIVVKLFASLQQYLPHTAVGQEAHLDVPSGITPAEVFASLGVPPTLCHLVVINGAFVPPAMRSSRPLVEDDVLAVWPPVAGG